MRKLIVLPVAAVLLTLGSAAPASAHVHGITPLHCLTTANANAGAVRAFEVSGAFEGVGLIPSDKGNAPLTVGDGGFDAPACR
jgi:hypothetical protein